MSSSSLRAAGAAVAVTFAAALCTAPATAAQRSTYIMNVSPSAVTVTFRAGSLATIEDVPSKVNKIVNWDDHDVKVIDITVRGCGREHTIKYEPATFATVLYISGDECSPNLQKGNR